MKKFIAILSLVLFVMVGCQDSASIVAPDNDSKTELEKGTDNTNDTLSKDEEGGNPRP